MTVDVKLLLAWHPFLFLWRKGFVKCLYGGGALTAICRCAWDVHPPLAIKCPRHKFCHKQGGGEVSLCDKRDILSFTVRAKGQNLLSVATLILYPRLFQQFNSKRCFGEGYPRVLYAVGVCYRVFEDAYFGCEKCEDDKQTRNQTQQSNVQLWRSATYVPAV